MTEKAPDEVRNAEQAARDYAWKWFQYHAAQRQTVFQFFFAIVGAILAGYFALLHEEPHSPVAHYFGVLIMVLCFLFWRLDCRGGRLVKLSEEYLRIDEEQLASILDRSVIRLSTNADRDQGGFAYLRWAHSFRQIYQYVFLMIAVLGFIVFVRPA